MVMPLVAVGRPRRVRWVVRRSRSPLGGYVVLFLLCWLRWRVRGEVVDEVGIVVDLLGSVVRAPAAGSVCSWSWTGADCLSRRKAIRQGAHPSGRRRRRRARGAGCGWSTPRAFSEPFSVPSGPITELNRPPEDAAHSDTGS